MKGLLAESQVLAHLTPQKYVVEIHEKAKGISVAALIFCFLAGWAASR
jgi:hypothetical protein